jgi:hypothetical protein
VGGERREERGEREEREEREERGGGIEVSGEIHSPVWRPHSSLRRTGPCHTPSPPGEAVHSRRRTPLLL